MVVAVANSVATAGCFVTQSAFFGPDLAVCRRRLRLFDEDVEKLIVSVFLKRNISYGLIFSQTNFVRLDFWIIFVGIHEYIHVHPGGGMTT